MASERKDRSKAVAPARQVAVAALYRVTDAGAYASRALDAEIARAGLDARDARLTAQIVYGSLRVLPELDRAIAAQLARPEVEIDPLGRAVLRASCFQLLYLDRVPARAVVSDAVELVGQKRGRALGGFVNAVLRKVASSRPAGPAPAATLIIPGWMRARLRRALGDKRLAALVGERPLPPPLCLRANPARIGRDDLVEAIARKLPSSARVEPARLSPLGVLVTGGGDPRSLPGYAEGWFAVQEEGAQLVGLLAAARSAERVADACAGHGNKTTLLASAVGETGSVTAIDIDEGKLDRIAPELDRLGLGRERVATAPIDLTVGTARLEPVFDLVLVDAPCTGLGTVHRRPDLLLRAQPGDGERLGLVQQNILQRAARLVRPGGRLLYAVCSPLGEEAARVAERFEAETPGFTRAEPETAPPLPRAEHDGVVRIGPWLAPGTPSSPDVYQVILWQSERTIDALD